MIEFKNYSYSYNTREFILENINIVIPKGSFTVVTGANGAGKTTFLLSVIGAVPLYYGGAYRGDVRLDNINVPKDNLTNLAQKVGIVLSDYESQLVTLTVGEEVAFSLENRGIEISEILAMRHKVLAMVGLEGQENTEVAALSGGQKQRLAIASMLAGDLDILLLDEPVGAIDPEGTEEIYSLLNKLNKEYGKTIIVVEHNLADVLKYADSLLVMEQGKLVLQGQPPEVLRKMYEQNIYRAALPIIWEMFFRLEQTGFYAEKPQILSDYEHLLLT